MSLQRPLMLSTSPLGTSDLLSCCLIAIGLVDASVVVLAEDLGIRRLATRESATSRPDA
jgi:hypothetical protein